MSFPEVWTDAIAARLAGLEEADLLRGAIPYEPIDAVRVRSDNRELVLFASNDYLGLSSHPAVRRAASDVVGKLGQGTRGSPLVCGHTVVHAELEARVASLKRTESALLCPSGFAANLAAITSLAEAGTTIFSDALNHASIIDGCRLAVKNGARLRVYPHGDVAALAALLEEDDAPRKLIVTDALFSMDGDLAPLKRIGELKRQHGALLVVDDAHGTLVFGDTGAGVAEHLGCHDEVDVHVGTLSKAVGGLGGAIATTAAAGQLILNRGRSYVFSTALPLSVVAGACAAFDAAADGALRATLWADITRCSELLEQPLFSPIVPIVFGSERATLDAASALLARGFVVPAIRPPTVPAGTSRLRLTLSAAHAPADVERVCAALIEVKRSM